MDWVSNNASWLFSGIGVVVLGLLVTASIRGVLFLTIVLARVADECNDFGWAYSSAAGAAAGTILGPLVGGVTWAVIGMVYSLFFSQIVTFSDGCIYGIFGGAITGFLSYFIVAVLLGPAFGNDGALVAFERMLAYPLITIPVSGVMALLHLSTIRAGGEGEVALRLYERVSASGAFAQIVGDAGTEELVSAMIFSILGTSAFGLLVIGSIWLFKFVEDFLSNFGV